MKTLTTGLLIGAAMIAGALVYHGRQLVALNERLAAVEHSNRALEQQLGTLPDDLPRLVSEGITGSAERVVGGLIGGARGLLPGLVSEFTAAAGSAGTGWIGNGAGDDAGETVVWPRSLSLTDGGPLVQFDIPQPVVHVDIQLGIPEGLDPARLLEAGAPESGADADEEPEVRED